MISTATLIWQTTYGGTKNDVLASFNTTLDGGYIMSGQTHSDDINVSGNHPPGINEYQVDGSLLKLAEGPLSTQDSLLQNIYPNPVNDILNIPFYVNGFVKIYDLAGREVAKKVIENFTLDLTSLLPGTYFLKIEDGKTTYSHRFIKD